MASQRPCYTRGRLRRVLFLCEPVSLSQVVRALVLARGLDRTRFEPHFAAASYDEAVLGAAGMKHWPVHSIPRRRIDRAVERGTRLYGRRDLARYVEDDLRLFSEVKPDVVVGDFRLSLPISARVAKLPLVTLANAYWSPDAVRPFPLPEHPIVRLLGIRISEENFRKAMPWFLRHFAAPVNQLRARHGLPRFEDFRHVLMEGDLTLFADVPSLVPLRAQPAHHHFIGALTWSPPVEAPAWLEGLGRHRPLVYVTLGSTGRAELLPAVLEGLADLPVDVAASAAGQPLPRHVPPNAHLAPMLPGDVLTARAALVVCNGGASTAYQALVAGRPVVGLPYNLDQYLAMDGIVATGAGVQVRAGQATPDAVRTAVRQVLDGAAYTTAAQALAREFASYRAAETFSRLLA